MRAIWISGMGLILPWHRSVVVDVVSPLVKGLQQVALSFWNVALDTEDQPAYAVEAS